MTDKEKLKKAIKLADAMYYAAQCLTTDASRLHKAMEEYHHFVINELQKEELVSKDLEEVAEKYVQGFHTAIQRMCKESFVAGAKWQRYKLMQNTIDVDVEVDGNGYPYIDRTFELYDYNKDIPLAKKGDKVKVIIINEN